MRSMSPARVKFNEESNVREPSRVVESSTAIERNKSNALVLQNRNGRLFTKKKMERRQGMKRRPVKTPPVRIQALAAAEPQGQDGWVDPYHPGAVEFNTRYLFKELYRDETEAVSGTSKSQNGIYQGDTLMANSFSPSDNTSVLERVDPPSHILNPRPSRNPEAAMEMKAKVGGRGLRTPSGHQEPISTPDLSLQVCPEPTPMLITMNYPTGSASGGDLTSHQAQTIRKQNGKLAATPRSALLTDSNSAPPRAAGGSGRTPRLWRDED